jgi:3-oxoacyl-[acyl-carrier-protein] synthase II
MTREVWITGIGLVSSLGIGAAAHWAALQDNAAPVLDADGYAPWPIHPLPALPWAEQIGRRDLRQMETWQRLGVFAAGLALDAAGAKPLAAGIDLTCAARPGERDIGLDEAIFAELPGVPEAERDAYLNQRLMSALRPTLFLAELPNLLAGSITISHGVARSSRTLMGEELAAAEALRQACLRIAHGSSEIALVGGANNAARWEELAAFAAGGLLWQGPWRPVAERAEKGLCLGGLGAFLVLEAADHARARGAVPVARLARVVTACARPPERAASGAALLAQLAPRAETRALSIASGAPGTAAELALLAPHAPLAVADLLGHAPEAGFPAAVALAALGAQAGAAQTLVSGFGAWRGEAMALVEAI